MHARLTRAQALLRHTVPDGDIAQVLDLALIALLEKTEARKFGRRKSRAKEHAAKDHKARGEANHGTAAPAGRRAPKRSRCIPAEVRRTVWERDQGRCTFTSASGVRCTETGFLEFDHREPFACGGSATVDNTRILCRRHNQHLARLRFGSKCGRVREESPAYTGFRPRSLLGEQRATRPGARSWRRLERGSE
jgi:hypothetical protein